MVMKKENLMMEVKQYKAKRTPHVAVNREFPQGVKEISLKLVNDNGSEPPVNVGAKYGTSGNRSLLYMIISKAMRRQRDDENYKRRSNLDWGIYQLK